MTLPHGALWQRMRQRALETIPPGSFLDFRSPSTLAAWQAQGTYTISSTSSSKFTIAAAPPDVGGALIADAAFHLDHALEQQVSLMKGLADHGWSSPAWQVVTFYYWSYFCAMALSRMLGHTVWFVTASVARQFADLATTHSARVTQGTYELSCGEFLSAGIREFNLVKRQRRLHEQLWTTTFDLFRSLHQDLRDEIISPQEERLFLAISNTANVLGNEWPSALRNAVNYRPGFAYTAPRFKKSVDSFSYLLTQEQSIDRIVDRLENNTIAISNDPHIEAQPRVAAKMLADVTILISRIAQALHDEIIDRNDIDRRWLASKRRFAKQHNINLSGGSWRL
ncbi:hypothetical protein [Cupriavidus gilardii]|uniref:hypothetical protein n=1 Tax=Cupriavidus gilardii TaxID=82541 RepID=UPI000A7EBB64|nr:hypothetical protein [Cupriavidus gilardii]